MVAERVVHESVVAGRGHQRSGLTCPLSPACLRIPELQRRMSAHLDAYTALERQITAMRSEVLKQFGETSPGSLSISDVCLPTHLFEKEIRK